MDSTNEINSEINKQAQTLPIEDVNYWANRWAQNFTGWHKADVNPFLIKYMELLIGNLGPDHNKKIFVPLCGKTKDLPYLLSLGFQVFGIEAVHQPIQELDKENSFEFKFDEQELTYSTADKRLQIYCGDLFECPIEKYGPFDCIWDRASFIAIEYSDRKKYIEIMKRSVRDPRSEQNYVDFRYLIETLSFDKTLKSGPPRSVESSDMTEYFEDWANQTILEDTELPETDHFRKNTLKLKPCQSVIYLLTPKSS